MRRLNLYNYPGWDLIHLYNLKAVAKIISGPLIKITGPIVLALCILVGLAVFLLYRKASQDVFKGAAPFMVIMLAALLIITYIPIISLWFPKFLYGALF